MSDVTEAPTQDAIAESLLGDETDQSQAEQPVAEPQAEVKESPVEQTEQQLTEEQPEDWLPSEQEKVFPDEVLGRYAQRYGLSEDALADPQIRQLVIDKINSDVYIRENLQRQTEVAEPEPVEEPTPQPVPTITREQYFANLDRVISERTDAQIAKEFHDGFLRVFGVSEAQIAQATPQQQMALTTHLSKFALNLVNTFVPDILQAQLANQITQTFPGFSEMYERSSYAMAWDRIRNSNPGYSSLPAYGSKEFSQTLRSAAERIPGFDEMQFTDARGNPLPMMDNAMRKYGMLAQIASGQNVDPQLIQKAAQAQVRQTRRAEVRRTAGNLGSGQSKAASGQRTASRFQTNTDLFDDDTMENYQRERGRL